MGSTASTTYQDLIEGKLTAAVSAGTTTNVIVKVKQINMATPTWPTAAHRLKVIQRTATNNKAEVWQVAAGTTQVGQTVTLGTLTRALPLSSGTDFTGSGTAQSFAAGADVFLAWDAHDAAMTPKLDITNAFTGANSFVGTSTFNAPIVISGATTYLQVPSLTTTQRLALTPTNGMIVYDSTIGVLYQYIGGAWSTFATGTVVNAANTTAGKVDIATTTEIAALTGTDATSGALNALTVGVVSITSASSGKIPALNTGGLLDVAIGGTGKASPATGTLLIGAGTSAMTSIGPGTAGQVPVSNGSTLAMGTAGANSRVPYSAAGDSAANTDASTGALYTVHQYTIPANDLIAGVAYMITGGYVNSAQSGTQTLYIYLGGNQILAGPALGSASGSGTFTAIVWGTAAAGSSVAVRSSIQVGYNTAGGGKYGASTAATDGTLVLGIGSVFSVSGSSILSGVTITRLSTSIS